MICVVALLVLGVVAFARLRVGYPRPERRLAVISAGEAAFLDAAGATCSDVNVVQPRPGPSHHPEGRCTAQQVHIDDGVGAHDEAVSGRHGGTETRIVGCATQQRASLTEPCGGILGEMLRLDDRRRVTHLFRNGTAPRESFSGKGVFFETGGGTTRPLSARLTAPLRVLHSC